jgi:hypothetical protein
MIHRGAESTSEAKRYWHEGQPVIKPLYIGKIVLEIIY